MQRGNIAATLFRMVTTLFQHCQVVLGWKSSLQIVSCNIIFSESYCRPIHSAYITSPILLILSSVASYYSLTMNLHVVMVNFPCWILSAKFNVLTSCATKSAQSCAGSVLSKSQIDNIIRESYKENIMCLEGGNAIPTMPTIGSPCAPSFSTDADNCLRTFHEKFAANKADPDLCSWVKSLIASIVFLSYWQPTL